MRTAIDSQGRVVIPRDVREKFGMTKGMEIEFVDEGGKLVVRKAGLREKILTAGKRLQFRFPAGVTSTDRFIRRVRGE